MKPSLPAGLCDACDWARVVSSKRASYLRCGLSDRDGRWPRYPPLPVTSCSGWKPAESDQTGEVKEAEEAEGGSGSSVRELPEPGSSREG